MPPRASRRGHGQVPGRVQGGRHRRERRSKARRRPRPARLPRRGPPLQRAARGLGRPSRSAFPPVGSRGRRPAPSRHVTRRRRERAGRGAMHRARARATRRPRRRPGPPAPPAAGCAVRAADVLEGLQLQEGRSRVFQLRVHQPRHAAHATRAQRRPLAVQRVRALVRAQRHDEARRGRTDRTRRSRRRRHSCGHSCVCRGHSCGHTCGHSCGCTGHGCRAGFARERRRRRR